VAIRQPGRNVPIINWKAYLAVRLMALTLQIRHASARKVRFTTKLAKISS
jgi:hypothetical protein